MAKDTGLWEEIISTEGKKVQWEELRTFVKQLFVAYGVPEGEAFTVADCLVTGELSGVESHGVVLVPLYIRRILDGGNNPVMNISVLSEHPATLHLHANASMGMPASEYAMQRAISKAREVGSAVVVARGMNHYGMAAYYTEMAAKADMVGISFTNAQPCIAPIGSATPYFGTNPISFAVPTHGDPIMLDMAASVVAMGKVTLAARIGAPIPEGWAITREGEPTTDAALGAKGSVLPMGGHKGAALGIMVDILSGILSGGRFGPQIPDMLLDTGAQQDIGAFFCAIDISKFVGIDTFKACTEQMSAEIRALPKMPGVERIYMPGEKEHSRRQERKQRGINLPTQTYQPLAQLGAEKGLNLPTH